MDEIDEDDDYEEWVPCRVCSGEQLRPGQVHECHYASNKAMSEQDEQTLLGLMNAAPISTWVCTPCFSIEEFKLGDWTLFVFIDGCDWRGWDYVDWVIAPDGTRYDAWPRPGEVALPASIFNWQPPKMGPLECAMRKIQKLTAAILAR